MSEKIVTLVEYISKSLVDAPDEVKVECKERDDAYVIELRVAQADMGKVIGKQGRIAKAIRTVVKAASVASEKKFVVDILDQSMKEYFELGQILKPQGLKGEVKVILFTDDPARIDSLEYICFKTNGAYEKIGVNKYRLFRPVCLYLHRSFHMLRLF